MRISLRRGIRCGSEIGCPGPILWTQFLTFRPRRLSAGHPQPCQVVNGLLPGPPCLSLSSLCLSRPFPASLLQSPWGPPDANQWAQWDFSISFQRCPCLLAVTSQASGALRLGSTSAGPGGQPLQEPQSPGPADVQEAAPSLAWSGALVVAAVHSSGFWLSQLPDSPTPRPPSLEPSVSLC